MSYQLTPEQKAVVHHSLGKHARVLAVAGSGKTTTMVHRVRHLVLEQNISPRKICILMFNRRARYQFKDKLEEIIENQSQRPDVHTFHSFGYKLISLASDLGSLPHLRDTWIGDREEMTRRTVHQAVDNLEKRSAIAPDAIDVDEALEMISLWKGSLIPPERAGHRNNDKLVLVYEEFERLRVHQSAITFDDFIPIAVGILQQQSEISTQFVNSYDIVIVDEYQDVNYGQQRLIEIVAGQRADIMVVGDDDQTIYEWRGARPEYITQNFARVFSQKPTVDYKLSHTFRFGPKIAQCAQNIISLNQGRVEKPLIAHMHDMPADIHIISTSSEQQTDVSKELTDQVFAILRQTHDPSEIIVLVRMFAQLVSLEAEFLKQGIPYRVVGRAPFFERREISALLDYLRLATYIDQPINQHVLNLLLSVVNMPNRKISRDMLSRSAKQFGKKNQTVRQLLQYLTDDVNSPANKWARRSLKDFNNVITRISEQMSQNNILAGQLLVNLTGWLDYDAHFDNYYGEGEASEDRKRCVRNFITYVHSLRISPQELLQHIETLDTTRGQPPEKQIVMTTVYRVKGEEFDYVIIPNCEEGYMPNSFDKDAPIYDTASIVPQAPASDVIEAERRLFYVAITRARKAVIIGTSQPPRTGTQSSSTDAASSRFLDEIQLEPTTDVMEAYQQTNIQNRASLQALVEALKRTGDNKQLLNNMLREYLPARHISLSDRLLDLLEAIPEQHFTYKISPPAAKSASKKATEQEADWWDQAF